VRQQTRLRIGPRLTKAYYAVKNEKSFGAD